MTTYTGEPIKPVGTVKVPVSYESQSYELQLEVMESETHPLLGCNWLNVLKLNWQQIFQVSENKSVSGSVKDLCEKYQQLFKPGLGAFKGDKARIHVDPQANPIYCKARPVPYALKD